MTLLHQTGEVLARQYRILNSLGQGGMGITYKAFDLQSNDFVAIKVISLRRLKDWKTLELFEREATILSQLHHPAIPPYIDYFQQDTPSDRCFYIVQQLATGNSLTELVEKGWKPEVSEVKPIATQLLEILVYLQEITPSVIHRDIKPQNIIRRDDGKVFLVDFGAVRDTYHNTVTGGSTVVGTFGYMAPEQFRGQAVLSTDLYGLGTTLLFLLTGKSPADLPVYQMKIKFIRHLRVDRVDGDFADWLEKMVEPVIEDRFASAKEALAVLPSERKLIPRKLVVDIDPVSQTRWGTLWFRFLAVLGILPVLAITLDSLLKSTGFSINHQYFYQIAWSLSGLGTLLWTTTIWSKIYSKLLPKIFWMIQILLSVITTVIILFVLPCFLFIKLCGTCEERTFIMLFLFTFGIFLVPIYLSYILVSTLQILLWLSRSIKIAGDRG